MQAFADLGCASMVEKTQIIPSRIEEGFRGLNYTLRHKLMVASENDLMRHLPRGDDTRFIPARWGVRRDDYTWRSTDDLEDLIAFREAAAAMASLINSRSIAAWSDLIPGPMHEVMKTQSSLYLADYWVLTLHYLVWAKKLPYSITARWVQGTSISDQRFYFVSELPVNLVEASRDALVLFQEAAIESLQSRRCMPMDFSDAHAADTATPPVCRNGRWRIGALETCEASELEPMADCESPHVFNNMMPDEYSLNHETFTIICGEHHYRFTNRNKQLFALLERLNRRPGHRVSFDNLRDVGDVWDGSPVEDSTIRGAIARLRKILKESGMGHIGERISSCTYQGTAYVYLSTEDHPSDQE